MQDGKVTSRKNVSVCPQFVECPKCGAIADVIIVEVRDGKISTLSPCCEVQLKE